MKKFLTAVSAIICLIIMFDALYYQAGIYIDFFPDKKVETFMKTDGKSIYMNTDGKWQNFEIKGVDMGSGEPGQWATAYSIDEGTYIRWFGQIQDMGANTVRIYTVQGEEFYTAYYKYNTAREAAGKEPLWLLHGVWVNDYVQHSHLNAYSTEFVDTFISDCRAMIDVIHGRKRILLGRKASSGSGSYMKDISRWVIGYILGVEWESDTVVYTDQLNEGTELYKGEYMYASEDASPFENMLARVGDRTMQYEADKYNCQKLIAFSNWCTTDPFRYSASVSLFWNKMAYVDVENIKTTDRVLTGHFASYHVYPYYPDYLNTVEIEKEFDKLQLNKANNVAVKNVQHRISQIEAPTIESYITEADYYDRYGRYNTYIAYLRALSRYHAIPVVISEFGVSTGRGIAQVDANTGRNQGYMSESEQGRALVECYYDIMDAGCAGSCIFSWQDEWFKRTWNTMHAVDLNRTPYWSDYQTNEQYFGLLAFDPGTEQSVAYVDGDVSEWAEKDVVTAEDGIGLSVKYDEKFVYFLIEKDGLDFDSETIYIPLDVTPKSGSNYFGNNGIKFEREADFVIVINGKDNSFLKVQERYEALRSTYAEEVYQENAYSPGNIPDKNSNVFVNVNLVLKTQTFEASLEDLTASQVFETGKLRYGNANPENPEFDSLADFCANGDYVEVRLPWQLLNFADPSRMNIHDDYYDGNYGIEYISIDCMYAGLCTSESAQRVAMEKVKLEGWGNKVTAHERLKSSYYVMQDLWKGKE